MRDDVSPKLYVRAQPRTVEERVVDRAYARALLLCICVILIGITGWKFLPAEVREATYRSLLPWKLAREEASARKVEELLRRPSPMPKREAVAMRTQDYRWLPSLRRMTPNDAFERTRRQRAWLPAVEADRFVAPALPRWWRAAQRERWASE